MNTFKVSESYKHRADGVAIALRKEGFAAWLDSEGLHTNASRPLVLLAAGQGLFLEF